MRKEMQVEYDDYDEEKDDIITYKLLVPAKNVICDRCEGDGQVDNPAFSNGFTQEELDEDPDFREDYFDGKYDVICPECKGKRVILSPDVSAMTFNQKRFMVNMRRREAERRDYERQAAAERAAERAFGC